MTWANPEITILRHFPKVNPWYSQRTWRSVDNNLDPENLLAMLYTWQSGDCSKQEPYNGDFKAAMQAIKAKMLVLPGETDLYFPCVWDVPRSTCFPSAKPSVSLDLTIPNLKLQIWNLELGNCKFSPVFGAIGLGAQEIAKATWSGWTRGFVR